MNGRYRYPYGYNTYAHSDSCCICSDEPYISGLERKNTKPSKKNAKLQDEVDRLQAQVDILLQTVVALANPHSS